MCTYTWNLFVFYFGVWTLQQKALSIQNKGHFGLQVNILVATRNYDTYVFFWGG